MSFHFGRKPCQALYYLHHNHKVGFNLSCGMPLGWSTGRLWWFEWDHFTLKNAQWETGGSTSPSTFFLGSIILGFCAFFLSFFFSGMFIVTSKQTPFFFLFSFIF